MKRNMAFLLILMAVTGICISCKNSYIGRTDIDDGGLITENPVTIAWRGNNDGEIDSFQTDIAVYVKTLVSKIE